MILLSIADALATMPPPTVLAAAIDTPRRALSPMFAYGPDVLAEVPDPPAKTIPGMENTVDDWLGYLKYAAGISSFVGLLCAAIMMGFGIRGRSDAAKWALGHVPWALGGAVLTGGAAALVNKIQGG